MAIHAAESTDKKAGWLPAVAATLIMMPVAIGLLLLFVASTPTITVLARALPMLVVGLGFGVVVTQICNVQRSSLPTDLRGESDRLAKTAKAVGVGLGTAVVASVMFGLIVRSMVEKVATQADVRLTAEERRKLVDQIEDETVRKDVDGLFDEKVPNLEDLTSEAYVEAFQTTFGLPVGGVLLAFLLASFIPRVEPDAAEKKNAYNRQG